MEACSTKLEFLAQLRVVAEKYQVQGVQIQIAEQMEKTLWEETEDDIDMYSGGGRIPQPKPDDFLAATKIVFDGTVKEDNVCRIALVKYCVLCILDLKKLPGFAELLKDCGDLGAAIIAHDNIGLSLQEEWHCNGDERFRQAVPRCPDCKEAFSSMHIKKNLNKFQWTCEWCDEKIRPICSEYDEDYLAELTWFWEE